MKHGDFPELYKCLPGWVGLLPESPRYSKSSDRRSQDIFEVGRPKPGEIVTVRCSGHVGPLGTLANKGMDFGVMFNQHTSTGWCFGT